MIKVYQLIDRGLRPLEYETFVFNGGEVQVKFKFLTENYLIGKGKVIVAQIQNSEDFFRLALIKNALENISKDKIALFLSYIPYARQDRICDKGEAFSLKVFTSLLNSLNFDSVYVLDPHSDVAPALINNVKIIPQLDIVNSWPDLINLARNCVLISPDSGANKKTMKLAQFFQHDNFVRADKLRDLSTGKITETIVYCDDFKGKDVIVFDDIADGGATFIELAKVCKKKNCGKFYLFVTHGIFSKGLDYLLYNGVDNIFFTNSFKDIDDNRFKYFDVLKIVKNKLQVN